MANVLEISVNQINNVCVEVAMGKYKVNKISDTAFKCEPIGIGYVWDNLLLEILPNNVYQFRFQNEKGLKSLTHKWNFVETTDKNLAVELDKIGNTLVTIFAKRSVQHKHASLLTHVLG